MRAAFAFCITSFLLYGFLISPAFAQWEYGGIEIIPSSWQTWDFNVSEDINGGILVAWEDNRVISNPDVYVQKVDTAGIILWQEYGVNGALSDAGQYLPFVASDGQGGAYMAWSDIGRNGVGTYDIYAQHFDPQGDRTWDDEGLNIVLRGGHQILDHMISDGQGGAVLCWSDDYWAYTDTLPVVTQRIDSSGNLLFGIDGIRMTTLQEGKQHFPQLVMTSDSSFVIIWMDDRLFGQGPGLYGQKFNINGDILWDSAGVAVAVETVDTDYGNFKIAPAPGGGFYTIWRNHLGSQRGISMQWNDGLGQPRWGASGYAITIGSNYGCANIITDFNGNAVIAWVFTYHIPFRGYLNIIDTTGTLYWPDHFLIGLNINFIYGISQSILGEFEIGLERTDLACARRILKFDMEGNYIWGDTGVCLTCPGSPSIEQRVVPDGVGGDYLSWKRFDDRGVMVNRVYPDGWVAPDTTTGIEDGTTLPDRTIDINVYPNPFNSRAVLNIFLPDDEIVEVILYDILGRIVKEVYRGKPPDTKIRLELDLSGVGLRSGVYFIQASQNKQRVVEKVVFLK